jgi:hypothetical protein
MDDAAVDFAIAAWREDGLWQVVLLPPRTGESLEALVNALRVVDDFGVGPVDIELLLEDVDMWPDEQLASIAARIGFGEQFDALLEQLPD